MIVGRGNYQRGTSGRTARAALSLLFWSISTACIVLLAGCSERQLAEDSAQTVEAPNVKLAAAIHRILRADEPVEEPQLSSDEPVGEEDPASETVADEPADCDAKPTTGWESFTWKRSNDSQPEPDTQQPPVNEDRYSYVEPSEEPAPQATEVPEPEVQQLPETEDRYGYVAMLEEPAPQEIETPEPEIQQSPETDDRYNYVAMPEEQTPQETEAPEPKIQQLPETEDRYSFVAISEEPAPQVIETAEPEIQQSPETGDHYSYVAMPEEPAPQVVEAPEPKVQQLPEVEDRHSYLAIPEDPAPQVIEIVEEAAPQVTELAEVEDETPAPQLLEAAQPFATLLPPQEVEQPVSLPPVLEPATPGPLVINNAPMPFRSIAALGEPVAVPTPEPKTPELDGLTDEERRLVEQVIRECSPAVTGVLTDARVNEMATTSIREANALANRGAQYAAKQKLVEVLRMVSQAKDAHEGGRLHTSALAAGLRALEEAEDFAPRGTQLEAELEISLITDAHRTPIAKRLESNKMLPRQMMDLYFRYAQVKLATSVGGEPAGSMALYALGKVTSQMGQTEPERNRLAHRRAVAFQQAALLAHNQNYFAAHELAVLLAESGHLVESENLLKQVASRRPNPTVYRNLAHVQQRIGRTQQAAYNRALATQMAGRSTLGSGQIRWVGPESFGTAQVAPSQLGGPVPAASQPPYDQRTAMTPPRAAQPYGQNPPRNWR